MVKVVTLVVVWLLSGDFQSASRSKALLGPKQYGSGEE